MDKQSYRWSVFKHWVNLAYLTGVVTLGLIGGVEVLGLGLLIEGFALWVLPDIPQVKLALDAVDRTARIERQRWYYLKVLWRVKPPEAGNPFISSAINWAGHVGNWNNTEIAKVFTRLCRLVEGLRDFQKARPESISNEALLRIDEMINGWLSLLYVLQTTDESLGQINQSALLKEFEKLKLAVDKADPDDKAIRIVLCERLRAIKSKVDSLPKLERRKALAQAQADGIVQHIEALSIQFRTAGVAEAGALLDTSTMLDTTTSFDELETAAEIRGLTSGADLDMDNKEVWADISSALGHEQSVPAPAFQVKTKTRTRRSSDD